jgi:RNA polymerase sigma-70 factor (ECF subfamily)
VVGSISRVMGVDAFEGGWALALVEQHPEPAERGPDARLFVSVDELSRKYRAVLLRYFMRRGIQHSDAQDLAQDVFYRLARHEALGEVDSVENYLFAAAANVARDLFRRSKVRSDHPPSSYVEDLQVTEDFTPERRMAGRQELDCVLAALNEMPERMRTIFILARLENMPRAEIAARLGVSKRTVEQSITQATACLAERRRRVT